MARYGFYDFEEDEFDNIEDKYILTIMKDDEEFATIVHRTVGGKYPLDGPDAERKRTNAKNLVDLLNAADVPDEEYAPRQWDGSIDAVIESDTNPWIQDAEGNVFDFGGDGMRELHASGVLVGGTYIQRDDLAGWQDSFTDLHAALVAAKMVEHITGRPHFVWYNGA